LFVFWEDSAGAARSAAVEQFVHRGAVAELLGITPRQVRKWLRLYRTQGLDALCTLQYRGGVGQLRPAQVEQLKAEVATGRFLSSQAIYDWVQETFHVSYSPRGMRDLLHRVGVSYHKATGFFWKANPDKQETFLQTHERHKQQADGRETRRYFVDACHPVWGVELLYSVTRSRLAPAA
jgi:transposase